MADIPETEFHLLRHDVPEPLVDYFLDTLRQRPTFARFSDEEWQRLTAESPNLRHFITATSTEIAPRDPLLREQVTASMLGLLSLLEQAKTNEELEALISGATAAEPSAAEISPEESKKPKMRGFWRSQAAFVTFFGLSSRGSRARGRDAI